MTLSQTTFEDIAKALKLHELSVEDQEEILLEISSLVFEGTLARIVERMDDDARVAFTEFIATDPDEEAMSTYLQEHVPGADDAAAETVRELANDILAARQP